MSSISVLQYTEYSRSSWLTHVHRYTHYTGSWSSGLWVSTHCKKILRRPWFSIQQIGAWDEIRRERLCVVLSSGRTRSPTIIFERQWGVASTSGVKPHHPANKILQAKLDFLPSPCYSLPSPPLFRREAAFFGERCKLSQQDLGRAPAAQAFSHISSAHDAPTPDI